jgi:hypothetical protein
MATTYATSRFSALVALVAVTATALQAQTAAVRGTVRDSLTLRPLQSASVVLSVGGRIEHGTASDGDGYFLLPRVPFGTYELTVSFIGYELLRRQISVTRDAPGFLRLALVQSTESMDEVVVEDEMEAGMANVRAGLQVVQPADIQRVPILGASGDLAAYLQSMPGVAAQGDRGGQLFIRGGSTDQNLALLDGMPIYQPFHVVSFFSAFPEEVVDHANVYTGAFGASYFSRLSSVIDVKMRNGNKERISGSASIAPFLSGARVEGPLVRDRLSFVGSVRQSLVEEITPNLYGQRLPYRFGDRFAKLHALIGDRHSLSATALSTSDRGDIAGEFTGFDGSFVPETRKESVDREVSWSNRVMGGRYAYRARRVPVFVELRASVSRAENSVGPANAPDRTGRIESRDARVETTILTSFGEVTSGVVWRRSDMDFRLGGQFQDLDEGDVSVSELSAFVESWIGRTGIPVNFNPGINVYVLPDREELRVEPRLRMSWSPRVGFGVHSVHAGAGLYHQLITGLSDERDVGNVFTAWVPAADSLSLPAAWHLMAGWSSSLPAGFGASVEAYVKSFKTLSVPVFTPFPAFTTALQEADGTARGIEIRLETDSQPFIRGSSISGYVAYSLSDVEYRSAEISYSPPHHRTHQTSAMLRVERRGIGISLQWQYGSGYPFTRSAGFDVWQYVTPASDVSRETGTLRVLYLEPYGGRQPNYERIDLWLDKAVELGRARATVRAGVMNVLNRDNLFYYDLFTFRRVNQMPITPSVAFRIDLL